MSNTIYFNEKEILNISDKILIINFIKKNIFSMNKILVESICE